MNKISALFNVPAENVALSPYCYVEGRNNLLGGYPAQIVAHQYVSAEETAVSKIYVVPVPEKDYKINDDVTEFSADYFKVGEKIYIYTNTADDNSVHVCTIDAIEKDETTSSNYTTLNGLIITLKERIVPSNQTGTLSNTSGMMFKPFKYFYKFKARSLEDYNTSRTFAKIVIDATTLGAKIKQMNMAASPLGTYNVANIKPTITKDGESFTRFSCSYSTSTGKMTITFTDSQEANLESEFIMELNPEENPSICLVEFPEFSYTCHTNGEYITNCGYNAVSNGNLHVNVGDFSEQNGIININLGMYSEQDGVFNVIENGSGNIQSGANNYANGRDNYQFGGRNYAKGDSNYQIGGLNKSYNMNSFVVGSNNKTIGMMVSAIGCGNTVVGDFSHVIGKDITIYADNAVVIGTSGKLPVMDAELALPSEDFTVGPQSGIHYKGAVAIAGGMGKSSPNNQYNIPVIFSKYRWKKNPTYPFGTGDSATVCPNAVGAVEGTTAATLRTKTTEDPVLLEDHEQATFYSNIVAKGYVYSEEPGIDIVLVAEDASLTTYVDYVAYTEGVGYTVTLDGIKSSSWSLECGTEQVTLAEEELGIPSGNKIQLTIINGATVFSFPDSWTPAGEIPALQSAGCDIFEVYSFVIKGVTKIVYKHVIGFAL